MTDTRSIYAHVFSLLGLDPDELIILQQSESLEQAQRALARIQGRVRKRYRALSKKLHPDHTQNDPAKTELFFVVKLIAEGVLALSFQSQQNLECTLPLIPGIVLRVDPNSGSVRIIRK